jgi:hypothetical protein
VNGQVFGGQVRDDAQAVAGQRRGDRVVVVVGAVVRAGAARATAGAAATRCARQRCVHRGRVGRERVYEEVGAHGEHAVAGGVRANRRGLLVSELSRGHRAVVDGYGAICVH